MTVHESSWRISASSPAAASSSSASSAATASAYTPPSPSSTPSMAAQGGGVSGQKGTRWRKGASPPVKAQSRLTGGAGESHTLREGRAALACALSPLARRGQGAHWPKHKTAPTTPHTLQAQVIVLVVHVPLRCRSTATDRNPSLPLRCTGEVRESGRIFIQRAPTPCTDTHKSGNMRRATPVASWSRNASR